MFEKKSLIYELLKNGYEYKNKYNNITHKQNLVLILKQVR